MDDLLTEFLTECFESMNVLDADLVRLEKEPNDPELIGGIFRIVHTIKGTCGFLGLNRLGAVAHAAENVLGTFRDGGAQVTPKAVTAILMALDRIKLILEAIAADQREPEGSDDDITAKLDAVLAEIEGSETAAPPVVETTDIEPEPAKTPLEIEASTPAATQAAVPALEAKPGAAEAARKSEMVAAQTLRVPVDLLESLMNLVGELVLTRNQLSQMVRTTSDNAFKAPLQRLSQITSELQEGVMKTRMQPIGNAWGKLPRIIRDLSVDLGKVIELKMVGAETELDRQVLELIKDPLTHMIRNSADHGLEAPSERRAAGKPEQGTITLRAYHEGGHVIIRIDDDGRGLDVERIKAKALANGLCTQDDLASMSPQQVMRFIFKPGFSTAAAVTSVSGRGVGMDVVRTNIEKIGGSIELASTKGQGSVFTIKIPLTLAIVPSLIVGVGDERFAIPQIGVVEIVRTGGCSGHKVEIVGSAAMLRLRDRLLPLLSLAEVLGLPMRPRAVWADDAHVVVSQVGTCLFGLIVDRVFDTEEIVVKPVAPILRDIGMFSGNTILGDGSVVMIVDLNGIVGNLNATLAEKDASAEGGEVWVDEEIIAVLTFKAGKGGRKAVPLGLVTRLEEIEATQVEWSGSRTVVQYRKRLMPLIDIDGQPVKEARARFPVLVFSEAERTMGLVVDEIVDIAQARIDMELSATSPAIMGTAIIGDRSTDLIDVAHFINEVFGGWFTQEETEPFEAEKDDDTIKVLLVDDSSFFRNLLAPMLTSWGYGVTTAISPIHALELRDKGRRFDIIVSDIEMPGMDGFAFAAQCRASGIWQDTPIIALTSHTTPKDQERGRSVGFTDYIGKLERQNLLETLARVRGGKGGLA